jgi:hypothetical protein
MARIRSSSKGNEWNVILDKFNGGTSTLLDEARIGLNQAKETINLIQVQDGLWKPRWGSAYYGQAISGESSILGSKEFIKSDGTRELIAIGGTTGKFFKSIDGGAWSEISGAVFSITRKPFFLQINNYLYITNGYDPLTRYNGSSLTQYTQISAPGGVSLTRGSGLSAGSYNLYYQITAINSIGETVGSIEQTITVNKDRDSWLGATSNEYVDISWSAVTGATRYQVYFSTESGQETLLDSTNTTSYRDDNVTTPNPYVFVPQDNTTGAPKFSQMELSGNRIWATKDPQNKYRVYFSGVGQYIGYFSAYYGGGWVDLEKGGRETPQYVGHYRTGKGDSAATVLCSTPEGIGAIWQITLEAVTIGDSTFTVPIPVKIVGTIGADAPYAVVKAGDNLIFNNKRGVFSLGNKENISNVLATNELSGPIRPSYRGLNLSKIENFSGYWYDAKIFFSLTEGSGENDCIVIYDMERKNWNYKWTIGVKQFTEYTDSSGNTHFLGIPSNGGQLIEMSENISGDLGQSFRTSFISGLIPISRNKKIFAKVKEALIEIGRPRGTVNFEVLGIEKKKGFSSLGSKVITDSVSTIDFCNELFDDYAFDEDRSVPKSFSQASVKKRLRVRKLLNAIQFHVYSDTADTDYTILSIMAEGRVIPTRAPSDWN